uniref:(northern house mosquito) hypothetical protein n=2 Tax=Culex pipiens TaxID=7175 RepID=A0A8D8D155_CULPI
MGQSSANLILMKICFFCKLLSSSIFFFLFLFFLVKRNDCTLLLMLFFLFSSPFFFYQFVLHKLIHQNKYRVQNQNLSSTNRHPVLDRSKRQPTSSTVPHTTPPLHRKPNNKLCSWSPTCACVRAYFDWLSLFFFHHHNYYRVPTVQPS